MDSPSSPLGSEDARRGDESEYDEEEARDTLAPLQAADDEAQLALDAAALGQRNDPAEGFGAMIGGLVNAVQSIFSHRSVQSLVEAVTERSNRPSNR